MRKLFSLRVGLVAFGILLLAGAVMLPMIRKAEAFSFCTCTCYGNGGGCGQFCCGPLSPTPPDVILADAFDELRDDFILDSFYFDVVEDDWKDMTDQIAGAWFLEAHMIGGFYDAQAHSTAMLELQKLTADAMNTYQPSEAVCQFGTLTKALGATDSRAKTNQLALSEIALSRHLGVFGNIAAAGRGQDASNRMLNFVTQFCNITDGSEAMVTFCSSPAPGSARLNHDIDYTRIFAVPETINADFTNAAVTPAENDLIALSQNLYGNSQIIQRMDNSALDSGEGQNLIPLIRSIDAKRSVAQNSFNAIAGMKATGSGASRAYVRQVLTNLGMSTGDIDRYMASAGSSPGPAVTNNPSYLAQMDILTKKVFQDPAFYVNLMDKPANVQRQTASMEGLGLMQDRDIFASMSRSEMLLAVLVEMEAIKLQKHVQNNITTK